ncbi:MAG: M20/M25/M40 family metallo-hydrolase [Actinobacteria bacterium]|jgi:acetylornithine deacetylase/succinyl-diaminopimelate desuccinylase-like protein|nr:M20/M25/M40 family metallo-hydrolase [Actinomycetota bacterium]MBT3745670.1 M20/M25/M40 family metallo-hydrolase [Actinomycetota bacterium]MBT3970130.1 M20/M25/M40 family metallo-hydrolase [Actinomycetota bacterium]MBT4009380.1 M20/M25/M40 family metallo-hydrolase [Actinomycetota bacterium]MBT4302592.1 M20/M25/M40 family metallo-hydrolase [Actinomycetota bacterium]
MSDLTTNQTVDLLQTMIRNACVNDGTPESGQEVRNADVLQTFLEGTGLDLQRYEPTPGRTSLVARIEGSDPTAPSLCLMGHTDVVPVNPDGWDRDPFGGELVDNEIWGRGAVDMLNLTAGQAVAFRTLANQGFKPRGDLIFFAVADEESGSAHGARWMADHHYADIKADYVLTENGGLHSGPDTAPAISVNVAEKGVAWRRLTVSGTPGHGSMPYRTDNALVKAAAVIQRLAEYQPAARFHELWRARVEAMGLPEEAKQQLLDEDQVDEFLANLPSAATASHLHACTHATFSPNVGHAAGKTNVIPDQVSIEVDIRTLPGDLSVADHLREALGDLADHVETEVLINDASSASRIDTPLWDSLERAINKPFPSARLNPQFSVGFTDARVYREHGAVVYGAGLLSPTIDAGEFGRRFHGHNERIDVESLRLTTQMYLDVCQDLLG